MKKLLLLFALVLTVGMNAWAQDADYLCFTAEEDEAYFQLYKYGTPTNVTLEYSTNGGSSWTDYTFTVAEVSTYGPVIWLQNAGDKVYFRNKSDNVTNFSTSAENYYRFSIRNNKISVSGNVMSLVDKKCAKTTIQNNYCFARLFEYCTSITSAPKLPATELKEGCYYRMFAGCNNLTNAPTLPARILKSYCYYGMFEGCTSLSHVEVGFTEWDPSGTTDALRWWMQDVSQTGTFECPKDLDTSSRSHYIPDGWTISQYMPDYLCFTTEKAASICLEKQGSPTEVTIEYSKDGMKWNTLTLYEYVEFQSGETLYLRNASETVTEFSKRYNNYYHFRLSSSDDSNRISASGNIMSLVDKSCNTKTIPCNYCFYELFSGNRNLTSAPKLPATTLAIECYENMFEDCTGLTEAPALPATSLSHACYSNMFSGCTGLVNAPELAATTLAEGCYRSMFQGCTGLTVAPELPATTLVRGCYENMFGDCTGLTEAPELPAPTLVEKCYYGMFDNCSNLRKVSVSFKEWFKLDENGATAGWLDDVAEEGEFICPPVLPNLTGSSSYIPENWTVKHPYLCFNANTSSSKVSLSKVGSPADVALEYSKDASVWQPYTFGTEISLSQGASVYFRNPSRTPTGFSTSSANYYHFSVEGDVAASGNIMTLVEKTGSITEMPDDYISLFYGLFSGCTGLTAAPELPATKLARKCYREMFSGCTNLVSAPELPATTLANYCYNGMFSGCTSLTSAPVLPATTLANYCYEEMFKDCSSLNFIKVGFTQWHENATRDWLSGVAAKGAFEAPVELDKTKTGTSNIPAGWAQALYHPKSEPTSRTLGYNQDCWEDLVTGNYYSDNLCTQELTKVRLLRYAKLRSNPITYLEEGGSSAENKTYEGVPFNWVAGGPFDPGATSDVGTKRHVEFTVIGTDVADARLKLYLSVAFTTRYYIRIFVNGTEKHKKLYDNNDDENFVGYKPKAYIDAYPLEGLKTGDVVCLEVEKNYEGIIGKSYYDACIEYTSFDASEIFEPVHHDAKQATYRTVGNIDHWEGKGPNNSRYYSDEAFTEELSPAQVFTYEKLISNPVTANNGFTIKEDVTYDGVQFNWAAETYYSSKRHTNIKSTVEFTVFGTDVENARVKWWKNLGDIKYARYTVNIYVNGTRAYSVNQFDGKFLGGFFAVPLQGLKAGDRVMFEVYGDISEAFGLTTVYIAACLEYTSSNGGKGNVIVKAADAQKYMGETDPELTFTTYPANIELSGINLTRDEGEEVGEYAIRMSEGEEANPDYDITFAEGKFTISKSPITITADDKLKLVGEADPELTWSVKGKLIEGHDLTGITLCREKGEESGTYSIYASQANGANPYYDITFADGTLIIADTDLPIYHGAAEPTYRTLGYTQNCWEDPATGKIYSDVLFEHELDQAKVITYEKLISNPVTANTVFTINDVTYDGVQFNWAAETVIQTLNKVPPRTVDFVVFGTDVENARVKWLMTNTTGAAGGSYFITVYVNGSKVYSASHNVYAGLRAIYTLPLKGLKTGDVVRFETDKEYNGNSGFSFRVAACLEYTSSNGGKGNVIVKADDNQKLMGEADPELTYTIYPADIELSGINLTRDEGEEAGEYAIRMSEDEGANPGYDIVYIEGKFTISKSTITITADDILKLVGEADPKLTWSVKGKLIEGHDLTGINLCREAGEEIGHYTISISQENGANPCYDITFVDGIFRIIDTDFLLYHRASVATYQTFGYAQNCWENKITGQFYSDVLLENELNPAQAIIYKKIVSNPVTSNNGFTINDVEYDGVQFNWAAETTYTYLKTGTRSVEFTVFGTDVDNARVKWTKNYNDADYGSFIITVYVNGTQVYSINQGDNALGGLSVIPLPDLKSGDKVKFEVNKPNIVLCDDAKPTITACLEYTSSNGGLNGMLITANQDPDHTENYYSTFWSSTDAYQVPEGVTAYTGKVEDSTSEPNTSVLKLTAIEDGIIPASQGVILRMTTEDNSATKQQIALAKTTATGTWSGTNALTGTDEATTLGANQYALSHGQNGVGFYLWEGKEIGANKAYLTLDDNDDNEGGSAKAFIFQFDEETTSIHNSQFIIHNSENDVMYNLNGMRVDENYKGIVIKNGKKVLQK